SRFMDAATAFTNARKSSVAEVAALAGLNLGIVLGRLDRPEDALAAYDEVITRYRDDPTLREQVANALYNKGATLVGLDRLEDALATFDEVIIRYRADPAPAVR